MKTLNKSKLITVVKEYNSNNIVIVVLVFSWVLLLQHHGYNIIINM